MPFTNEVATGAPWIDGACGAAFHSVTLVSVVLNPGT